MTHGVITFTRCTVVYSGAEVLIASASYGGHLTRSGSIQEFLNNSEAYRTRAAYSFRNSVLLAAWCNAFMSSGLSHARSHGDYPVLIIGHLKM